MKDRDKQFLALYQKHRYEDQIHYYEVREAEFEQAQRDFINISTLLMILAALMSILASLDASNLRIWWAMFAAVLPTLSAALSTYNNLYAFERQAKLYQDALHRLHEARSQSPQLQGLQREDEFREALKSYVDEVEKVFLEERGQWGQLADEIKPIEPPLAES